MISSDGSGAPPGPPSLSAVGLNAMRPPDTSQPRCSSKGGAGGGGVVRGRGGAGLRVQVIQRTAAG